MEQRDFPDGTSQANPSQPYSSQSSDLPPQSRQQQPSQQWPTAYPVRPIPAKRRRHPVLSHAAVAIVALGIGAGIGSAGHGSSDTPARAGAAATSQTPASAAATTTVAAAASAPAPAPAKTTAAAPAAPATTASTVPTTVSGDGEYLVGTDMQPGTYRTAGPAADSIGDCYWERDKNASGDFGAIIANDNLTGNGMVTVKRGEYFKSTGCQDWVRVG